MSTHPPSPDRVASRLRTKGLQQFQPLIGVGNRVLWTICFAVSTVLIAYVARAQTSNAELFPSSPPDSIQNTSPSTGQGTSLNSAPTLLENSPPNLPANSAANTNTETGPGSIHNSAQTSAAVFENSGLSGKNPSPDRNYKVPLLFAPEDNGFELGRPQIRWDLSHPQGVILTGLRIKASEIGFVYTQASRVNKSGLLSIFERKDSRPLVTNISFRWPQIFSTTGTFTLEDPNGQVVWSQTIGPRERAHWRSYLKSDVAARSPDTAQHASSAWGLTDLDPLKYAFLFGNLNVRACLTSLAANDQKLRVCTGQFSITTNQDGKVSFTNAPNVKASALLEGKEVGIRGLLNFPENKKINFGVRFATGAEINITSQPVHLKIYDAIESETGRTVLLTGEGAQPVGRVKMLKSPEIHFWSGTIIKQERIWQLAISKEAPVVKVLGAFNMPFDLLFEARRLPKEADRVYIADRQTQTYARLPNLYGTGHTNLVESSNEFAVKKTTNENFTWEFLADHESDANRARIKIAELDGTTWVAHYDMFRAPASEISGHLMGVLSSTGQTVAMGELSAFHWFEDLGVSDNRTFALQHWGIDVRYFKGLSSFQLSDSTTVKTYDQLSGNLRYNLNRGIWNRDEIFGIMLSGERLEFATLSASMIGPGAYWGRTMPKLLDDVFNWVPLLRHPKYLEVEFSYVPFAISAHTVGGATYNLNFRGKVFWGPSLFGELGFGIKQLQFTDTAQSQQAAFATGFGLIGLGLLF